MRLVFFFFFSSRRRHTRYIGDWSSDVCSSDLIERLDRPDVFSPRPLGAVPRCVRDALSLPEAVVIDALEVRHVEKHVLRSEERRVGKECRSRWGRYPDKKKKRRRRAVLSAD